MVWYGIVGFIVPILMDYPCGEFDDFSYSRFGFITVFSTRRF